MSSQFTFMESSPRTSIGLTPLIDVVFILLLFFMLATNFEQEGAINLQLPDTGTDSSSSNTVLLLKVLNSGEVSMEGKEFGYSALEEMLSVMSVSQGKRTVLIRSESDVSVQTFVSVVDIVRASGFESISVVD